MRGGNFATRAEISENFETNRSYNFQISSRKASRWYKAWILNHHFVNSRMPILSSVDSSGILSFSAAISMLTINMKPITKLAFTPIIPYPATEYDTIFMTMVNFQDVMQQRGISYGPLWSHKKFVNLKEFVDYSSN